MLSMFFQKRKNTQRNSLPEPSITALIEHLDNFSNADVTPRTLSTIETVNTVLPKDQQTREFRTFIRPVSPRR